MKIVLDSDNITIENYKETIELLANFKEEVQSKFKGSYDIKLIEDRKALAIRSIEKCKVHGVERGSLQSLFYNITSEMGFDEYAKYESSNLEDNTFENDVFLLRPFSWKDIDCSCGLDEEESDLYYSKEGENIDTTLGFHAIECYCSSDRVVNFWYKPTNLKINWYKYPFRDAFSNQKVTYDYLEAILKHCKKSMNIE